MTVGQAYLEQGLRQLRGCHQRIEHCLGQLDDAQVWWRPRESMNAIGNIVLHLCGNLRQWVLSGAGGEPDVRNRPQEFAERGPIGKVEVQRRLAEVIAAVDAVLGRLSDDDLLRPRRIQGFDETVLSALFDALTHLKGHMQEIVYITRLQLGDAYRFAWAPSTPEQGAPGGSP